MDKKLVVLFLLFFLAFGVFTSILVFNKPLTQLARAKEDLTPSAEKSKMLAYPLYSIAANGKAVSVINVFVNSITEKPLANKVVGLTTTVGTVSATSATTDTNGKAEFRLSSTTPGIAKVEATVEGVKLLQTVTIKFE